MFGRDGEEDGREAGIKGVLFPIDEGVKDALKALEEEGRLVQLGIEIPAETLTLALTESNVTPASVAGRIPESKPRYTFYRYPNSDALFFIYTCPSGSSIKERMVYASCRAGVLIFAAAQGLTVSQRIETPSPEEITAQRLEEEVNPPREEGPKRAFARPKRPGR